MIPCLIIVGSLLTAQAWAAEYWVHQDRGNNQAVGTKELPFQSIDRGLKSLKPGDTLHVLPASKPYPNEVRIEKTPGTADLPITIDGHGSIVSGWKKQSMSMWQDEGGGIFSRKMENNAWSMYHHWEGGFDLVHFDGRPGLNLTSQDELKPGSYFLYKNRGESKTDLRHNTLYICLAEGETPDSVEVEGVTGLGGIYVGSDYVVLKNFITEYGGRDGFATFRGKGIIFENIEARFFMDQGMSNHGSEVIVRNAYFHNNAGCGIVDVYPESVVRYENCLIENNPHRGGVQLSGGTYVMENCVVRGNDIQALSTGKGARVTLIDCAFIQGGTEAGRGIFLVGEGSALTLIRCRISGFPEGLSGTLFSDNNLSMENSVIEECQTDLKLSVRQKFGKEPFIPASSLSFSENLIDTPKISITALRQEESQKWLTKKISIDRKEDFERFIQFTEDAFTF